MAGRRKLGRIYQREPPPVTAVGYRTMNPPLAMDRLLSSHDLRRLHKRIVLVKSTRDHRNPQSAVRGTLVVHDTESGTPSLTIEFDIPQMFQKTAHHRVIRIEPHDLARLLESETAGVFEYTTDEPLD
jgi:hypothetical protein